MKDHSRYPNPNKSPHQTSLEYWTHFRDCAIALQEALGWDNSEKIAICDREIARLELESYEDDGIQFVGWVDEESEINAT